MFIKFFNINESIKLCEQLALLNAKLVFYGER